MKRAVRLHTETIKLKSGFSGHGQISFKADKDYQNIDAVRAFETKQANQNVDIQLESRQEVYNDFVSKEYYKNPPITENMVALDIENIGQDIHIKYYVEEALTSDCNIQMAFRLTRGYQKQGRNSCGKC